MPNEAPKPGSEARFLRAFRVFQGLSERDVRKIVDASRRVSLPARWPVMHEQTPADACYILLAGRVAVYAGTDPIAELGPGDVMGEVALRKGRLRSATVSTVDPVEMLQIEHGELNNLLRNLPELQRAIDATVAEHGGGQPAQS